MTSNPDMRNFVAERLSSPEFRSALVSVIDLYIGGFHRIASLYKTSRGMKTWKPNGGLEGNEKGIRVGYMNREFPGYRVGMTKQGIYLSAIRGFSWFCIVFPSLLIPWDSIEKIEITDREMPMGVRLVAADLFVKTRSSPVKISISGRYLIPYLKENDSYCGELVCNGKAVKSLKDEAAAKIEAS